MIFFEVGTISKLAKVVKYDQLTFSCEFEFSKFAEKGSWKSSTTLKSFARNIHRIHVVFKKKSGTKTFEMGILKNYTREINLIDFLKFNLFSARLWP